MLDYVDKTTCDDAERLYRSLSVILEEGNFVAVIVSLGSIMYDILHDMIENKRDKNTDGELINEFIEMIGERLIESLNITKPNELGEGNKKI